MQNKNSAQPRPYVTRPTELAVYSLVIMNNKENGELLLTVPCRSRGRRWNRVLRCFSSRYVGISKFNIVPCPETMSPSNFLMI